MVGSTREGSPTAEIVAIGDELIFGHGVDTNSAWLSLELAQLGLEMTRHATIGDGLAAMTDAIGAAAQRADVVVVTGGLGPTEDDRTRAVLAQLAGVELEHHEPTWQRIQRLFSDRGRVAPDSNRRQAEIPVGATRIDNHWGTAPGFALRVGDALVLALPGVPREMKKMFAASVVPLLQQNEPDRAGGVAFLQMHVVGPSEADLGERIGRWMADDRNPRVGITAHYGELTVRIAAVAASDDEAQSLCAATAAELRPAIGADLIYEGERSTAAELFARLDAAQHTLAAAESCTAGLFSAALADVPGSSRVLQAGYVTYANEAKMRDLEVPADLFEQFGAVSEPVAERMAIGAAQRAGTTFGVSVTGVAGPGGGTEAKPVGTVCFGLHDRTAGETEVWTKQFVNIGRRFIRERAVLELQVAMIRRVTER